MLHAEAYLNDDKAQLHNYLKDLAEKMRMRGELKNVALDSFIISATPFVDLRKKYDDGTWDLKRFGEAHILFMEDREYIKGIMENFS